jgi:hypothetical protein
MTARTCAGAIVKLKIETKGRTPNLLTLELEDIHHEEVIF